MKKMARSAIFIFICTLVFYNLTYSMNKPSLDERLQKIITQDQKKYHLPAISVSILLPDASSPKNFTSKKIDSNSYFQIGSITKTFVASIIMQLIEGKKLNLDAKLSSFLPAYSRWRNITIRDLLQHTSGVYNYTQGTSFDKLLRKNPEKNWSLKELSDMAYSHTDFAKPGEKFHYTNTDYILLGLIIEKIKKQSIQKVFDDYLQRYHLSQTFYTPSQYPSSVKERIVHGYNRDGTFQFNTDVTNVSMSYGQSAGAMVSTPNDLIKWLRQLFTGKIIAEKYLFEMMNIISEETAKPVNIDAVDSKQFSKNNFTEVGSGYGMGLIYFPNYGYVWAHAGGTLGYESFYAYNICNGIYVVIMHDVKPKQQLIFTKIASHIFQQLMQSNSVQQAVAEYQKKHAVPSYCFQ
jgi:D-alanyl-D-alanine carboxypeptidase